MSRLVALLLLICSAPTRAEVAPPSRDAVRDALWEKEKQIYAARNRGDRPVYRAAIASDYLAWPPYRDAPAGDDGLRQTAATIAGQNRERLDMELVAFR